MDVGIMVSKVECTSVEHKYMDIHVEPGELRRLIPKYHHLYNPSKATFINKRSSLNVKNQRSGYAPIWIHHIKMGELRIEKTPPKSITDERNMTSQGEDAKWSNSCKITSGKCTSGITVISKSITNEWVIPSISLYLRTLTWSCLNVSPRSIANERAMP